MQLEELQQNWNQFGERDPLYAILKLEGKQGNKWNRHEFFETGKQEVSAVLQYVEKLGLAPQRGRALDFGCGVGRLTQALADHFEAAVGVDLATSMVKLARRYNRFGTRCTYYLNNADNLRLFSNQEFHFIYTNMVLQHMRPEYAKSYIQEFLRLLKPQGVLIFQLPSRKLASPRWVDITSGAERRSVGIKGFIKRYVPEPLWRWYVNRKYQVHGPTMEMYGTPRPEVEEFVRNDGARIVDVVEDECAGPNWESLRYCITRD